MPNVYEQVTHSITYTYVYKVAYIEYLRCLIDVGLISKGSSGRTQTYIIDAKGLGRYTENGLNVRRLTCLLYIGLSRPLFLYFRRFNTIKFDNDWI